MFLSSNKIRKMKTLPIPLLVLVLFTSLTVTSQPVGDSTPSNLLTLVDSQEDYVLVPYLEILADPNQDLNFQQVSSPLLTNAFLPASDFDFSINPTAYWLRLNITNQASANTAWLLLYESYRANYISVYLPNPDTGGYREIHTGNALPFPSRDYDYHYFVFNLDIPADMQQTIYLYLSDVGGISLDPLKIQSLNSFSQVALREQFLSGAYYSSILVIALFTIFFIFSLNDRNLFSFFLLLLTVLLLSLSTDGLGHQIVWPNWTAWTRVSTASAILIYLAAFLHYTLKSLETRKHFPRLASTAYILIVSLIAILLMRSLLGINSTSLRVAFIVLLLLGFVLPIYIAFRSLKAQKQQAQYFLLAFSVYLVIMVISILSVVTGNEIIPNNVLTRVGFIWILLIFLISTNIRINIIRQEHIQTQGQLLKDQQEALQLQTQLTDVMRQSHDDIVKAYDTTLEGWAQLLELRDKETEGHSRKVVDLTFRFAKQVGIPDDELVHIRRGALLHDIGKIAIPDIILLKPGPLTDEEWDVMRQHPIFALKFLSNIPYLKHAMDIPVYHHERWDGTGYFHQLKGEDIPLSARIFTIIDNWDALLSDRPYRAAWSISKTRKYILDNSGSIFDPTLVPIFLDKIVTP